jgi:hypothetical protein
MDLSWIFMEISGAIMDFSGIFIKEIEEIPRQKKWDIHI